jgi:hypothetical protein
VNLGIQFERFYRPGKAWDKATHLRYQKEFSKVAAACFDEVPSYQVMSATLKDLENYVIVVARNEQGQMVGFVSGIILPMPRRKQVLHLGLTCVDPNFRNRSLTHLLTSKMILLFFQRHTKGRRFWITNCACVLSSLANVALHFEKVYPSPFYKKPPSKTYAMIAEEVSTKYRDLMYVHKGAKFNPKSFIFEGSVEGTVFAKDGMDKRFHHRNKHLTNYYQNLINFERGDEVLQIGQVSALAYPKYLLRRLKVRIKTKLNMSA